MDCGLYVLGYALKFCEDPAGFLQLLDDKKTWDFNPSDCCADCADEMSSPKSFPPSPGSIWICHHSGNWSAVVVLSHGDLASFGIKLPVKNTDEIPKFTGKGVTVIAPVLCLDYDQPSEEGRTSWAAVVDLKPPAKFGPDSSPVLGHSAAINPQKALEAGERRLGFSTM